MGLHVKFNYFGKTTGLASFSSELGKKITDYLTKVNIVKYQQIDGNVEHFPQNILAELNCDQKYLHMISRAVQEGRKHFDEKLASLSPETVHNTRWLTKANRILRLYFSTLHPSVELISVVSIILTIKTRLMYIYIYTSALRLLALHGWRTLCVRQRLHSVAWVHIG